MWHVARLLNPAGRAEAFATLRPRRRPKGLDDKYLKSFFATMSFLLNGYDITTLIRIRLLWPLRIFLDTTGLPVERTIEDPESRIFA